MDKVESVEVGQSILGRFYRRHQRFSHLPDDQPVMAGVDKIVDFLQWLGLRHLRLLRKIAEDPETSSQMVH